MAAGWSSCVETRRWWSSHQRDQLSEARSRSRSGAGEYAVNRSRLALASAWTRARQSPSARVPGACAQRRRAPLRHRLRRPDRRDRDRPPPCRPRGRGRLLAGAPCAAQGRRRSACGARHRTAGRLAAAPTRLRLRSAEAPQSSLPWGVGRLGGPDPCGRSHAYVPRARRGIGSGTAAELARRYRFGNRKGDRRRSAPRPTRRRRRGAPICVGRRGGLGVGRANRRSHAPRRDNWSRLRPGGASRRAGSCLGLRRRRRTGGNDRSNARDAAGGDQPAPLRSAQMRLGRRSCTRPGSVAWTQQPRRGFGR